MGKKSGKARSGASPLGRTVLCLLVTLGLAGVYYYVMLPPLNPRSYEFYLFIFVICAIFVFLRPFFGKRQRPKDEEEGEPVFQSNGAGGFQINLEALFRRRRGSHARQVQPRRMSTVTVAIAVAVLAMVVALVGTVISLPMFHADAYYGLLPVEEGNFAEDVTQISYDKIPMLDADSAIQLGRRALGNISSNSNLVSQFEVSDYYAQINYNGQPVRVSPLEYGNLIKWFNNRSSGLPGYIVVNMVTQEARLIQLEQGMRYSTCEHFGRNLYRYLRFQYPTFLFGDVNFEIDEEGNPWWICSREVKTIGLFGGVDTKGAVLVNAVTGEHQYYEEVPSWVDRVYSADLLVEQYNYRGSLINGWINSFLGQKGVTAATEGYNYIAMSDDVYMYTGITSAGSDESNVGFILVNQRTKESRYYNVTGAEEYSAMSSAEGAVQHLNYSATFPILLNISDQPTYFMALKDSAELVKMYAMVNVSDYQITATGSTVAACQSGYEEMLAQNGIKVEAPVEETPEVETATVTGVIGDIRSAVIEGNTFYYFRLGETGPYYTISAAESPQAIILNVGDQVRIDYEKPDTTGESDLLTGTAIQRLP